MVQNAISNEFMSAAQAELDEAWRESVATASVGLLSSDARHDRFCGPYDAAQQRIAPFEMTDPLPGGELIAAKIVGMHLGRDLKAFMRTKRGASVCVDGRPRVCVDMTGANPRFVWMLTAKFDGEAEASLHG